MMVQAIIIYYFLPLIIVNFFGVNQQTVNEILSATRVGLITVSLNTTAYLVEVLRGGIESLNKGQMEAARSLGMTRSQAMIHVILPQGAHPSLISLTRSHPPLTCPHILKYPYFYCRIFITIVFPSHLCQPPPPSNL